MRLQRLFYFVAASSILSGECEQSPRLPVPTFHVVSSGTERATIILRPPFFPSGVLTTDVSVCVVALHSQPGENLRRPT